MSRPQKIIPPIKGDFQSIIAAVAMGGGKGKRAAIELQARKATVKPSSPEPPKKP